MTTPTIAAVSGDLGERCQIIVGSFGYLFAGGQTPIRLRPQAAYNPQAAYIASEDYLTMRDADYWTRFFSNDWRGGCRQLTYIVSEPASKKRFYDSTGMLLNEAGRATMARAVSANAYGTSTNATAQPLTVAGTYLYVGDLSKVSYSVLWGSAPATAATSAAGNVTALENDGQYVYGAVAGVGINRWAIGSASAGTSWNTTSTSFRRILWANRIFYAHDAATLYSITTAGVATALFTPPTGWTLQDISARRGGSISAPIYILGTAGNRSFVWYWDGTTVNDYLPLPNGFVGLRLLVYQGIIFVYGYKLNPDASASPCAYYIQSDTLGFLGYLGLPQTNGNPTPAGVTTAANYAMAADDTFVYFTLSVTAQDIWRYDIVNGALTRFVQVASGTTNKISDIAIFQNGPWVSVLGSGLYGTVSTFVTTATLDTSDINIGQPWASNLWASIEIVNSPLAAGEQVACSYSTDAGATYTSAGAAETTLGSTRITYVLSSSTASVKSPYARLRFTFTSGTSQATSPYLVSYAVRAAPIDPTGTLIETFLACPDELTMPNGGPDWQGASGSERLANIVTLYEAGSIIKVIYMAPGTTRAKNPTTISAKVVDYEILMPPGVGLGPNKGVEGTVRVVLRQVTSP